MGWLIGRAEAVSNPQAAKQKALAKLRHCAELDDPESLVVPILIDALLLVESLRGARHQITFVPELTFEQRGEGVTRCRRRRLGSLEQTSRHSTRTGLKTWERVNRRARLLCDEHAFRERVETPGGLLRSFPLRSSGAP